MYKPSNRRIVSSGTRLNFIVERTGNSFVFIVRFVAVKHTQGGSYKGVRFFPIEPLIDPVSGHHIEPGIPFPQGASLYNEDGVPFKPGDDYALPKRHASCSLGDVDGMTYPLFSVELVDEDSGPWGQSGGVLYYHNEEAIPQESGDRAPGILKLRTDRGYE